MSEIDDRDAGLRHPEAGMARMLRTSLSAALAPDADYEAMPTARSAAQIVGLPGLDACLAALEARAGRVPAPALAAVAERLRVLASAESLADFRSADPTLAALALEAAGGGETFDESGDAFDPGVDLLGPEPTEVATLTVAEALDDMSLAGDGVETVAGRTRLTVHVAAALRAALEWLTRDHQRPRPFRLRAEDSLLEVTVESVHPEGLLPAHEVLAAADGSLAPVGETQVRAAAGAWTVRVPAWSPRPVFLMIEQGALHLALPWHAVLRLSMVPAIEIQMRGGQLATPVLPPLVALAEGIGERPVVAIAHGLKRGLVVADRLVWRLAAEAIEPDEPAPLPELTRAVMSDEGDAYWIAEPRVLLHAVPLPKLPAAAPAPPPAPPAPPRDLAPETPAPVAPLELTVLRAEDVEPLEPEIPSPPAHVALPSDEIVVEEWVVDPDAGAPVAIEAPPAASSEPTPTPAANVEPAPAAPAPPAEPVLPVTEAPAKVADAADSAPAPAEPGEVALPQWLERLGSTMRVAPVEPPAPGAPAPRRAVLVAEDSIAAGRFLTRMLEQAGFEVQTVETAAEFRRALGTRRWALVCVDVEMPDARGADWLAALVPGMSEQGVTCVALVRDDDDTRVAAAAGVRRWLRKPFDREELMHLLRVSGLQTRASA